jgi:hydrogenase expression/formation protein HypC
MCLGEIAEVVRVQGRSAEVASGDRTLTISLLTLDDPLVPGDWVLVHSGFALSRLTESEARLALRTRAEGEVSP